MIFLKYLICFVVYIVKVYLISLWGLFKGRAAKPDSLKEEDKIHQRVNCYPSRLFTVHLLGVKKKVM